MIQFFSVCMANFTDHVTCTYSTWNINYRIKCDGTVHDTSLPLCTWKRINWTFGQNHIHWIYLTNYEINRWILVAKNKACYTKSQVSFRDATMTKMVRSKVGKASLTQTIEAVVVNEDYHVQFFLASWTVPLFSLSDARKASVQALCTCMCC